MGSLDAVISVIVYQALRDGRGFRSFLVTPHRLGWETIPSLLPWVQATKLGTQRLHQVVEVRLPWFVNMADFVVFASSATYLLLHDG